MVCVELKDGILETLNDCADDALFFWHYADFNLFVDVFIDVSFVFSFLFIVNFMFCIYLFRKIK